MSENLQYSAGLRKQTLDMHIAYLEMPGDQPQCVPPICVVVHGICTIEQLHYLVAEVVVFAATVRAPEVVGDPSPATMTLKGTY